MINTWNFPDFIFQVVRSFHLLFLHWFSLLIDFQFCFEMKISQRFYFRYAKKAMKTRLSKGLKDVKYSLAPEQKGEMSFFSERFGTPGIFLLCIGVSLSLVSLLMSLDYGSAKNDGDCSQLQVQEKLVVTAAVR